MPIKVGDFVEVNEREPTPADQKAGTYYRHFHSLSGTVDRVYDDGCVCVVVDHATLSSDMLARLKRSERLIKPRWKVGGETAAAAPAAAPAGGAEPELSTGEEEEGDQSDTVSEADAHVQEEETQEPETPGEPRPGLRYSIVLRAEDVRVLTAAQQQSVRGKTQETAAKGREVSPARLTEQQILEREQQYMAELQKRAAPK